jgi:peroxiredoxin
LIQFQHEYQGRGFTVIGVSMDADGWKSVKPFIVKEGVNYPVVIGNKPMAKPYGLDAMPVTFLIGRDGKIAATSVGIIDRAACERQIRDLLATRR